MKKTTDCQFDEIYCHLAERPLDMPLRDYLDQITKVGRPLHRWAEPSLGFELGQHKKESQWAPALTIFCFRV